MIYIWKLFNKPFNNGEKRGKALLQLFTKNIINALSGNNTSGLEKEEKDKEKDTLSLMETILNEDITLDERIEKFKNIPYLTSSLIQKVRERKIKMSPYLLYSPPFNTFLCDLYNTLQQKEKTEEFRKLYEQYIQLDTLKWEHLETLQKYYNNNDTVKDYIILEYKFFEQEYEKIKNKKGLTTKELFPLTELIHSDLHFSYQLEPKDFPLYQIVNTHYTTLKLEELEQTYQTIKNEAILDTLSPIIEELVYLDSTFCNPISQKIRKHYIQLNIETLQHNYEEIQQKNGLTSKELEGLIERFENYERKALLPFISEPPILQVIKKHLRGLQYQELEQQYNQIKHNKGLTRKDLEEIHFLLLFKHHTSDLYKEVHKHYQELNKE